MYDSVSPSSASDPPEDGDLSAVRADSQVRLVLAANEAGTHVARVFERGSLRVRFPRGPGCEAVLLNTGGGITGGDRLAIGLTLEAGAAATLTSQAAEKIYRSDGPPARIAMTACLGDDASLDWLPQETILFDRARVRRSIDVDLAKSSRLTMLETLVLGRIAHGESLTDAHWHDAWRIRRDGRLVFAETISLAGPISSTMQRPAIGAGARAVATLLHLAPDAEEKLDAVRAQLDAASSLCAASAWNGMLVARFADADPQAVRRDCMAAVTAITGALMPRAWSC
jgi:urease accessory protein